jgi:hypothetical protein
MKDPFNTIKSFLTLSFIVLAFKSQAQTYSTVIKDSDITTLISSIGETLKINKLDSRVSKWTSAQIFGAKGSETSLNVVGLVAADSLKKYFTKADIDFVCSQFNAAIQSSWSPKDFIHYKIIDSLEVDKIYKTSMNRKKRKKDMNNNFYRISIPLFSLDRKMAVIKRDYDCGFLCETECFVIYKISAKGEWVSITQWNCLSD